MDEKIFNRLSIIINKAYYTHSRYKSPSTFALLYHENDITPAELGKYVRKTDHFLAVDKSHYFINFAFTEQDSAFKACQNLIFSLDKHFENQSSYIAIDTFDESKSARMVYNRLSQILAETKKSSYSRIEDENILNELF